MPAGAPRLAARGAFSWGDALRGALSAARAAAPARVRARDVVSSEHRRSGCGLRCLLPQSASAAQGDRCESSPAVDLWQLRVRSCLALRATSSCVPTAGGCSHRPGMASTKQGQHARVLS